MRSKSNATFSHCCQGVYIDITASMNKKGESKKESIFAPRWFIDGTRLLNNALLHQMFVFQNEILRLRQKNNLLSA